MSGNLPLNSRLKIMNALLCVIWVLVFPWFRNLNVMCLVLPTLKNVLLICTWQIRLLKSLWEELMMFLFLQIGTMCLLILLCLTFVTPWFCATVISVIKLQQSHTNDVTSPRLLLLNSRWFRPRSISLQI